MPDISDELDFDAPDTEHERRLRLIPFQWQDLPLVAWPHGNKSIHSFEGWVISSQDGRKLMVQAVHQEFIYAGALLGSLYPPTEYLVQAITRA